MGDGWVGLQRDSRYHDQKKKKKKDTMTTLQLQGGINAFAAVGIDRDE